MHDEEVAKSVIYILINTPFKIHQIFQKKIRLFYDIAASRPSSKLYNRNFINKYNIYTILHAHIHTYTFF